MPAGRPTSFKSEFVEQARKLCELGATDVDLADFFGVAIATLKNWSAAYPEFLIALKVGKESADDRVERSLYHKANGYSFDAVKIFQYEGAPVVVPYREHVPPDTTACIFWLKNRRSAKWRDVQKHEHGDVGDFDRMTDEDLVKEIMQESQAVKSQVVKGNARSH